MNERRQIFLSFYLIWCSSSIHYFTISVNNIIYCRTFPYFHLSYLLIFTFFPEYNYVKGEMFSGFHLLHTYTGYHSMSLSLSSHQLLKLNFCLYCCNILFYKIFPFTFLYLCSCISKLFTRSTLLVTKRYWKYKVISTISTCYPYTIIFKHVKKAREIAGGNLWELAMLLYGLPVGMIKYIHFCFLKGEDHCVWPRISKVIVKNSHSGFYFIFSEFFNFFLLLSFTMKCCSHWTCHKVSFLNSHLLKLHSLLSQVSLFYFLMTCTTLHLYSLSRLVLADVIFRIGFKDFSLVIY